jgi:hypothetical protein
MRPIEYHSANNSLYLHKVHVLYIDNSIDYPLSLFPGFKSLIWIAFENTKDRLVYIIAKYEKQGNDQSRF